MLDYWINRIVRVSPSDSAEDIKAKAASLRPDSRQLSWQQMGFSVFVHFGMNTFTDREWGEGTEDPSLFNPTEFNAEQWVRVVKASGAGLLILTCKHHDGFCLWPSKYTEHSVKNAPYKNGKGDIVKEVSDACGKYGIKFGIYYSPWDRHEKTYGTDAYNDYYKNQLTELLTNYGPIYEYWLDGACGEGPNGKRQIYDWVSYWTLAKSIQPDVIITGIGPDTRWCGNEAGHCRVQEWNQVFISDYGYEGERSPDKDFALTIVHHNLGNECREEDLFGDEAISRYAGQSGFLMWYPPMVDTSIRPGWFYHSEEDGKVKTLDELTELYLNAVGGNSMLLLNIPPDRRGLIHETDAANMIALGAYIDRVFSNNLLESANVHIESTYEYPGKVPFAITYNFQNPVQFIIIELQEDIKNGQSVSGFRIEALTGGQWQIVGDGFTIGARRLIRCEKTTAQAVRFVVTDVRSEVYLSKLGLYVD